MEDIEVQKIGMYVDQTLSTINRTYGSVEKFAQAIMPWCDMICVEMEEQRDSDGKTKRKWRQDELMILTDAVKDMPIQLMWWPDPDNLDDILDEVDEISEWLTFIPVLDCEGQHTWGKVHADDAAVFGRALKDMGPFRMTCVMERYNKVNTSALRTYAHTAGIQTYSRNSKSKPERQWGKRHGPGAMQTEALEMMQDQECRIALDLPMWGQEYPSHPVQETMEHTLNACGAAHEIYYFSSKQLIRDRSSSTRKHSAAVRKFVASI